MIDCNNVKPEMRVKITKLSDTQGMMIKREYLDNRLEGSRGTVISYVPGHGGDVWWVKHDDGKVAAYMFTEMEPA